MFQSAMFYLKYVILANIMGHLSREREIREREREIILLRSIVNMMIHVQIKITMKDYVD